MKAYAENMVCGPDCGPAIDLRLSTLYEFCRISSFRTVFSCKFISASGEWKSDVQRCGQWWHHRYRMVHLMYIKVLCQCDGLQNIRVLSRWDRMKGCDALGGNAKAPFPPVAWGLPVQCKSLSLSLSFVSTMSLWKVYLNVSVNFRNVITSYAW